MASSQQPWPTETTYAERWRVAQRVARRERQRFLRLPNVVSVGVGLEHTGKRKTLDPKQPFQQVRLGEGGPEAEVVPCVLVKVRPKWRTAARRKGCLPEWVPAFVTVGGKRRRIRVPVDVVETVKSALHLWECEARTPNDSFSTKGTTTAFVRLGQAREQMLLSCHHVLALTEKYALPTDVPAIPVKYQGNDVGHLVALPVDPSRCDAALASCAPPQPQITFSLNGQELVVNKVIGPNDHIPPHMLVLTRRGLQDASLVGLVDHSEWYGGFGRNLTFHGVIEVVARPGSSFEAGDSGAAVLTEDGVLIGLHFAGTPNGGPDSFSFNAGAVFEAFTPGLSLW